MGSAVGRKRENRKGKAKGGMIIEIRKEMVKKGKRMEIIREEMIVGRAKVKTEMENKK